MKSEEQEYIELLQEQNSILLIQHNKMFKRFMVTCGFSFILANIVLALIVFESMEEQKKPTLEECRTFLVSERPGAFK